MAALPPAPWLNPPDISGAYQHGAQLGLEQQRLNRQAQQHAMELQQQQQQLQQRSQIEQQKLQQKSMLEQQQLEISKAYHQAQIGMAQQKLQEASKVNDAKIKQAADMSAARMQYEQGMQSIDADPSLSDDQKKQSKFSLMTQMAPRMAGGSMAGAGSFVSAANKMAPPPQEAAVPADSTTGIPAHISQGGRPYFPPGVGAASKLSPEIALEGRALETAYAQARKDLAVAQTGGKPKVIRAAQAAADSLRDEIRNLGKPEATAPKEGSKSIRIVRDPNTGKLMVTGGDMQTATLPNNEPQNPPLTEDMFARSYQLNPHTDDTPNPGSYHDTGYVDQSDESGNKPFPNYKPEDDLNVPVADAVPERDSGIQQSIPNQEDNGYELIVRDYRMGKLSRSEAQKILDERWPDKNIRLNPSAQYSKR